MSGCKEESQVIAPTAATDHITGSTMGTSYNVKTKTATIGSHKSSIDSILLDVNQATSSYIESSVISTFNKSKKGISLSKNEVLQNHFIKNLNIASMMWKESDGFFDPSCMPLVNYWGFGYTTKRPVTKVDSLRVVYMLQFVGFDKIAVSETQDSLFLLKTHESIELDFGGIAKGYGVDVIAAYLNENGFTDYMVEIGGEVRVSGTNSKNQPWTIGINKPLEDASVTDFQWLVTPGENALASSGNYRNYYEVKGRKYGHSINPKTGYPEATDILGASVIHPNCTVADAMATSCMVLGREKAMKLIENTPDAEACLIYLKDNSIQNSFSSGFEAYVKSE